MYSTRLWMHGCVAGLMTTVGLAWACALWSPATNYDLPPVDQTWQGHAYGWSFGYWVDETWNAKGCDGHANMWNGRSSGEFAAGGPYYAFWSRVAPVHGADGAVLSGWSLPVAEMVRRGVSTSRVPGLPRSMQERRLPLAPAWAGLCVDMAFWGLVWVLAFRVGALVGFTNIRSARKPASRPASAPRRDPACGMKGLF